MQQIEAGVAVSPTPARARRLLGLVLREQRALTLPLAPPPETYGAGSAGRRVAVVFEPAGSGFERFGVRWGPCVGGPFLAFQGEIDVAAEAGRDGSRIVLRGSYVPPPGLAGQAFEFILGRRIAIAIANGVLQRVRATIERMHAGSPAERPLWSSRAV